MLTRSDFLLRPDVIFFNHGSFGACPRVVFEAYQAWQRALESEPVEFIGRRLGSLLRHARQVLAAEVNVDAHNLVYVSNATTALNILGRSLALAPGDEILTTDQEYGAIDRTFRFVAQKIGASYRVHPTALPLTSHADFAADFWRSVTEKTRVILMSHITSPTALILPVEEICKRAQAAGITTIIDGAHALGQIPLDLAQMGPDFYAANCHKWLCAPKGAAFLYAHPRWHAHLDPLVVSWGWQADHPGDSLLVDHHEWQGTRDPAAFLSVPAAIAFQQQPAWREAAAECHALASHFRQHLAERFDFLPPLSPDNPQWYAQMVSAPVPGGDHETWRRRLYAEYHIEIPFMCWRVYTFARLSAQVYNTPSDLEKLLSALADIF